MCTLIHFGEVGVVIVPLKDEAGEYFVFSLDVVTIYVRKKLK